MHLVENPMLVAKDQFLSWSLLSARASDWKYPTSAGASRYSFFQARNALYHSLDILGIAPGSRILAPSYICRAAIDPLIAYGAIVDFYPVTPGCSVDLRDLERRITPATRAIMIVHYFGFPQPVAQFRKLCDAYGLELIEDCAHVLSGEADGAPLGTLGDAAVFSWRKFLPIYDGAELLINRPGLKARIDWTKESSLFTLKVAANMLDAGLVEARQPILKLAYRGIRAGEAAFRKVARRQLQKSAMMQAEPTTVSFDVRNVNWPMSRPSRWAKNHSDIGAIIQRRRRNYEMLLEELFAARHVQPLFQELPRTVCPWVFPVIFPDLPEAYKRLRSRGIPATTWGWVRHPLVGRNKFIDSDFLYDNLVFLPIHQCLEEQDVLNVARTARNLTVLKHKDTNAG